MADEKTKRRVFYSFHYKPDNWRASQVRNIGTVEGNKPASDNDWESITKKGDKAIQEWIDGQMSGRSCCVVLVGEMTAKRKWINYEIVKAWNDKKGVVGINIHGLKNAEGHISEKGANPFDSIVFGQDNKKLSTVVKCYNPQGTNSKDRYAWIEQYIGNAIEEAIKIRNNI